MKSQAISLIALLENVFKDASHGVNEVSLSRDLNYVKSRFEMEGLSFLSKTLPRFAKSVLEGLESGVFTPPSGFKRKRGGLLPAFMQGWTKRLFSPSGEVLADADPYSLSELVQICMLFYKLELPHSKEEEDKVVSAFLSNEEAISSSAFSTEIFDSDERTVLARSLIQRLLGSLDPRKISPKHGPGSVATGEKGNGKFTFARKFQRLHQKYPYYEYFSPSLSRYALESGWYSNLDPALNAHAKVVLVPKDSRGPRLISMEPLEIQWIQQGLFRLIVDRVESHSLTRGLVNFTDQSINQSAALRGSLDRSNATLDLKDASDRVSLALVRYLFPENLCEHMEACRSVATYLPDGRLVPLSKFAPMGSALCFPIMAITIWALSVAAIRLKSRSRPEVLVYGDDLIIPREHLEDVSKCLTDHGLVLNEAKCFHAGFFRESCGVDAYKGVITTPLRLKTPLRGTHPDHSVYTHLIEASESFFNRGYWHTCEYLRKYLHRSFGKIPWTHDRSYPGFYCPDSAQCDSRNYGFRSRFRKRYDRREISVLRVIPIKRNSPIDWRARMLKGLTGLYAYEQETHQVTVRKSCILSRRWTPA